MRILGLDPGLRQTGWGVIEAQDNRVSYIDCGVVCSDRHETLPVRLRQLYEGLVEIVQQYCPQEAAVEETFMNKNAASALKLGQARGIVLLAPAMQGIFVGEYAANVIKKSVTGAGHADKQQVEHMIRVLLPKSQMDTPDEADALAVAVCHAHHRETQTMIERNQVAL